MQNLAAVPPSMSSTQHWKYLRQNGEQEANCKFEQRFRMEILLFDVCIYFSHYSLFIIHYKIFGVNLPFHNWSGEKQYIKKIQYYIPLPYKAKMVLFSNFPCRYGNVFIILCHAHFDHVSQHFLTVFTIFLDLV